MNENFNFDIRPGFKGLNESSFRLKQSIFEIRLCFTISDIAQALVTFFLQDFYHCF